MFGEVSKAVSSVTKGDLDACYYCPGLFPLFTRMLFRWMTMWRERRMFFCEISLLKFNFQYFCSDFVIGNGIW